MHSVAKLKKNDFSNFYNSKCSFFFVLPDSGQESDRGLEVAELSSGIPRRSARDYLLRTKTRPATLRAAPRRVLYSGNS